MISSIEKIEKYTQNLAIEDFKNNNMITDAVIRNFEILGEAANHLPIEVTSHFSEIPWLQMKGFRNLLIHEYFGIDTEIVWVTIFKHLSPLKIHSQNILIDN